MTQVHGTSPLTPLHIVGKENLMMDVPSRSFGSKQKWHCTSNHNFLTFPTIYFPPSPGLLDHLPTYLLDWYACDFCIADKRFYSGIVTATTKGQESCWKHWSPYVTHLGVDPVLQDTLFMVRVHLLSGFATQVRTGYYGQGKQVQAGSVSSAIMAVGQAIALATNTNPTKIVGSDKLLPRIQQMLDGFCKADPPTIKQLLVEVDVPEFLV